MSRIVITDSDTVQSLRSKLRSSDRVQSHILVRCKDVDLLLENFRLNRTSRPCYVDDFIKDHLSGEFHTNSVLAADISGRTADGENRLRAQKILGIDQEYLIDRGLTEQEVAHLDRVHGRTPADQLKLSNRKIVTSVVKHEGSKAVFVSCVTNELFQVLVHEKRPSLTDRAALMTEFKAELVWLIGHTNYAMFKRVPVAVATLLAARYAVSNDLTPKLEEAVGKIKTGENINGILLAMREYLQSFHKHLPATSSQQSRRPKDSSWAVMTKLTKAWKKFLTDEPYKPQKKKAKLQAPSDFGSLLEEMLGESREEVVERLQLKPAWQARAEYTQNQVEEQEGS